MINLSSKAEDLMRELREDHEKALFWLKKHWHGEKGYGRMRDLLRWRCEETMKDQTSEVVEYVSKNGNRWLTFEHAKYYPKAAAAACMPFAFCYYTTASSVGAFVPGFSPTNDGKGMQSCVIFTPHFFERFCERLEIKRGSADMVKRFLCCVPYQVLSVGEREDDGLVHVMLRLPASVGKGIRWNGRDNIYEIRTFLTDVQMTRKQYRESEPVRRLGDVMDYEPEEIKMARLMLSGNPLKELNADLERLEKQGFDVGRSRTVISLGMGIAAVFSSLGLANSNDYLFWQRHGEKSVPLLDEFAERAEKNPEGFVFFTEYVALAEKIAAIDGIRNFNRHDFAHRLLTLVYKWTDEEADNTLAQTGL